MVYRFSLITAIALAATFLSQSIAGPNECTYYYDTTKASRRQGQSRYTTSCGLFGWDRCARTRYYYYNHYYSVRTSRQDCCSGWRKNSNGQCLIAICTPSCQHGGTCYYPNTCRCKSEYYGEKQYCSLRCPRISNCKVEQCTNPQNATCQECNSNVSSTSIAYELSPNRKNCVSRCSWLNNWCWPGYCTGSDYVADTCTCAPGFSGSPKCLQVTQNAEVLELNVSLVETARHYFSNYTYLLEKTVYTNVVPDKAIVTLKAQFDGPQIGQGTFSTSRWKTDYRNYTTPPWIHDYRLGITRTHATLNYSRQTETSRNISQSDLLCKYVNNTVRVSNSALLSPVDCTVTFNLSQDMFSHDEQLDVEIEIENGGYIVIANMDVWYWSTRRYYYNGTTKRITASFILDRVAPVHCSVDNSIICPAGITSSSMLSVGPTVTKQSTVTVTWDGWYDTTGGSGISAYTLEIYHMERKGNSLSETATPFDRQQFSAIEKSYTLKLGKSSLISIVLYVHDLAGNYRIARRFVLYDESSTVKIDSHYPISLPHAVNTGHTLWKTVNKDQLFCNWTGHFYNSFIRKDSLLGRISSFRESIDKEYDQSVSGTLGRHGVINYAGIVNYKYAISHGLNSQLPSDSTFHNVPIRATGLDLWQHYTVSTSTNDGNHITLWIQAIDIWGNSNTDNIMIHVDFSIPYISNVGLTRNGEKQLAFLHSTELHTMKVAFSIEDPQSGIVEAFWKLGETQGGSQMGQGRILTRPKSQSECDPSNCSCTPLLVCSYFSYNLDLHPEQISYESGQHSRTYYFTINATNDARLSSSKQVNFTVDASPPLPGHVIAGKSGQLDIDSQQSRTIHAYWRGFNDPDSGIHHYKYAIETTCLSKEQIISGKMKVYRTNSQFSDPITVDINGMYYVSVVAYNNALEPSDVVCSDGITIQSDGKNCSQISCSLGSECMDQDDGFACVDVTDKKVVGSESSFGVVKIAGIGVALFVGVLGLVIVIVWLVCKKRRLRKSSNKSDDHTNSQNVTEDFQNASFYITMNLDQNAKKTSAVSPQPKPNSYQNNTEIPTQINGHEGKEAIYETLGEVDAEADYERPKYSYDATVVDSQF